MKEENVMKRREEEKREMRCAMWVRSEWWVVDRGMDRREGQGLGEINYDDEVSCGPVLSGGSASPAEHNTFTGLRSRGAGWLGMVDDMCPHVPPSPTSSSGLNDSSGT